MFLPLLHVIARRMDSLKCLPKEERLNTHSYNGISIFSNLKIFSRHFKLKKKNESPKLLF